MPIPQSFVYYEVTRGAVSSRSASEGEKIRFANDVGFLDEQARLMGNLLGMTSPELCAVSFTTEAFAFRCAESSIELFDICGVTAQGEASCMDLIRTL